jgi:hypothetical protein
MEKRQKIQERMKQYLLIMINKRNMQEISKKREHRGDGEECQNIEEMEKQARNTEEKEK